VSTPLRALCPPFDRDHGQPLPSAPAAPGAWFEVEHLGRRERFEPSQGVWRQQRDVFVEGKARPLRLNSLPGPGQRYSVLRKEGRCCRQNVGRGV
jgi:hypothetical protein